MRVLRDTDRRIKMSRGRESWTKIWSRRTNTLQVNEQRRFLGEPGRAAGPEEMKWWGPSGGGRCTAGSCTAALLHALLMTHDGQTGGTLRPDDRRPAAGIYQHCARLGRTGLLGKAFIRK